LRLVQQGAVGSGTDDHSETRETFCNQNRKAQAFGTLCLPSVDAKNDTSRYIYERPTAIPEIDGGIGLEPADVLDSANTGNDSLRNRLLKSKRRSECIDI